MSYLVVLAIGVVVGAVGMFYVIRNGYVKVNSN